VCLIWKRGSGNLSFLSDIGGSLVTAVTGANPADLQAELTSAEQQLTLAVQTIIGLEVLIALEGFMMVVLLWKMRRE
jgi:hypothetical protein